MPIVLPLLLFASSGTEESNQTLVQTQQSWPSFEGIWAKTPKWICSLMSFFSCCARITDIHKKAITLKPLTDKVNDRK